MQLRLPIAVLACALLCGCDGVASDYLDPNAQGELPGAPCKASVKIDSHGGVLELRSKDPLVLGVDARPKVTLTLVETGAELKVENGQTSLTAAQLKTPGAYTVHAVAQCPDDGDEVTLDVPIHLVRLGVTQVDLAVDAGARMPLMFHAVNGLSNNYLPLPMDLPATSLPAGDAELDLADGGTVAFPEPWAKLDTPPLQNGVLKTDGVALPISLLAGTQPKWSLTLGKTTWLDGKVVSTGLDAKGAPAFRAVADETPALSGVGRFDVQVTWHVEAQLEGGSWLAVPGTDGSAPVRLYGVLGNALGLSPPAMPWLQVVDEVAQVVQGKSADPTAVRDLIVQHIYEQSGLRYESNQGASMYTTYTSGTYLGAQFDLSGYLKRSAGSSINCSDCASVLSTYSSMVGAKLDYCILVLDFPLNPILGLGATAFGSPFRNGNMSFKYHAVTSPDSGGTVFDATLAVDGDTDPKNAPQLKKLVQHQSSSEYLMRLSPGTPRYQHVDQKTALR